LSGLKLKKIKLQGLSSLQSLFLSYNKISNISLEGFINLTDLSLYDNPLQSISLKNFPAIKVLNLSGLKLKKIKLQGLSSLQSLNLSGNKISNYSFLKSILQILHLNYNQNSDYTTSFTKRRRKRSSLPLNYNPDSDFSFLESILESLNLGKYQILDFSFLQGLSSLQSLDLSGNKISSISFLQGLSSLQSLDLSGNKISNISYLQGLSNLQSLNLSGNKISNISYLQGLSNLQSLNLSWNQISDFPFLQGLSNLQSLDLWNNKISNISFLQGLSNLQSLNLCNNKISDFSFLQGLSNLQSLNLSFNKISDFPFLQGLNSLQSLDLSFNEISDISLEGFTNLTNLKLIVNPLQSISLKNFPAIKVLNLSGLKLKKIKLQGLNSLQSLDLERNRISDISLLFLRKLPDLQVLNLYNNPIQNIPIEIFEKSRNVLTDVRNYLEDLEKTGKDLNQVVKAIFIGNGSVGKTQIAKRLIEQDKFIFDKEHHSTHAIVRLERELVDFQLNCWDFGGQDIYHSTHRVFMQTRALLVLVWDYANETQDYHEWQGQKYENEKLKYWLEYARCFAPKSPILVLQNKIDELPQDLYFEYKEQLKQAYPILDFLSLSAKTGERFEVLEWKLEEIFQEHPTFQTPPLPTNWLAVRETIKSIQANADQNTLSISEFESICQAHEAEQSTSTILGYLHDTGVFYYRQGYFQNQIILNQDWAIQAIYQVLNRESEYFELLQYEKGQLDYKWLGKIWANNTDKERALFMDFMLSAELAFETTKKEKYYYKELSERTFIVPQLLPSEKPSDVQYWEQKNTKQLQKVEIPYRFLPKVFIQRFIVKAQQFSQVPLMWQKGLLLQTREGSALVEAHYEKEKQKIIISAENKLLIQKIKEELAEIANEGKFRSKEGKPDELEKFGLSALNVIKSPLNDKTMKNKAFIEKITESNGLEISNLLNLLKNNYPQFNSQQKNLFSKLKDEFIDQPNNFSLSNWKARMITLISGLDLEITTEDNNNQNGGKTSGQNISQSANTIINIENINTANFNQPKDKED
jgi:internalin A